MLIPKRCGGGPKTLTPSGRSHNRSNPSTPSQRRLIAGRAGVKPSSKYERITSGIGSDLTILVLRSPEAHNGRLAEGLSYSSDGVSRRNKQGEPAPFAFENGAGSPWAFAGGALTSAVWVTAALSVLCWA